MNQTTVKTNKQTNKTKWKHLGILLYSYSLLFQIVLHPQSSEGETHWSKLPLFLWLQDRTVVMQWHGFTHVCISVCSKSAYRGAYRERRQGGIGYLLVCSRPETYKLIISKNKGTHVKRVHIYTASTVREANWQLYLHVCSLGEDHQPGSCRSLADLHTHTLCQHHSHRKGEERKENWI